MNFTKLLLLNILAYSSCQAMEAPAKECNDCSFSCWDISTDIVNKTSYPLTVHSKLHATRVSPANYKLHYVHSSCEDKMILPTQSIYITCAFPGIACLAVGSGNLKYMVTDNCVDNKAKMIELSLVAPKKAANLVSIISAFKSDAMSLQHLAALQVIKDKDYFPSLLLHTTKNGQLNKALSLHSIT